MHFVIRKPRLREKPFQNAEQAANAAKTVSVFCGGGGIIVRNVAIVRKIAVATRPFLSHLHRLVMLRCVVCPHSRPLSQSLSTARRGEGAMQAFLMTSVQQVATEWVTFWKNIL